jgi:catechol-2,3-dioxygenase
MIHSDALCVQVHYASTGEVLMAPVVELEVQDQTKAAGYYEALLAVNPQGQANGVVTLVGDHVTLKLRAAGSKVTGRAGVAGSGISLPVTRGMFARVLDAAMQAKCEISVNSPEQVQFTDHNGQCWTLHCRLS